jgi:hypothetical protein
MFQMGNTRDRILGTLILIATGTIIFFVFQWETENNITHPEVQITGMSQPSGEHVIYTKLPNGEYAESCRGIRIAYQSGEDSCFLLCRTDKSSYSLAVSCYREIKSITNITPYLGE